MRPRRSLLQMHAGIMALMMLILIGLAGVVQAQSDSAASDPSDQEVESVEDASEADAEEPSEQEQKEIAELTALARDGRDDELRQRALEILAEIQIDEETGPAEIAGFFASLDETLGPNHPVFGSVLNDYGRDRLRAGDFPEAWRALDRSLAVHRELLAPEDLALASILKNLALAYDGLRLPGRAVRARRHRLAILRRAVDPKDPKTAGLRSELAATHLLVGAPDIALSHAFHAERLARQHFVRTGSVALADRAIEYEEVRRRAIAVALSVLASERSAPEEKPPAPPSDNREEASAATPDDDDEAAVFPEKESEHGADAAPDEKSGEDDESESGENEQENAKPAAQEAAPTVRADAVRQVWDKVIRSRTAAFDQLAGDAASASAQRRRIAIGLTQVSAALPAESSLLAFVRYERVSNRPPEEGAAPGPRLSYIAFTLTAGSTEPEAISLGDADRIDPLISRVRELAVMIPGERPGIDEVAGRTYVDAAGELRGAIWDPVAPLLARSRRIFIVPDGAISLVSFAALPVEAERYLVETGPLLHYLSAERDLVRPSRRDRGTRGLLAIGGPDFDAEIKSAPGGEGSRASCADLRSMTFEALPGSRDEAKAIADIWKKAPRAETSDRRNAPSITILTDRRATEEALRTLAPQHAVLHLATRSFFAPGTCRSILDAAPVGLAPTDAGPAADDAATIAGEGDSMLEEATAVADLPHVLSGLALAGANLTSTGEAPAGGADGILTAEEIASLDLSAIDWAVLGATGSGLDGAANGARVDSLRHAFEKAGAGTLIMSLWPTGDEASLAWLKELYEGRLSGLETAEAMRAASVGLLEARRESGRSILPIDWGAYVAAGDWR